VLGPYTAEKMACQRASTTAAWMECLRGETEGFGLTDLIVAWMECPKGPMECPKGPTKDLC
jgi:hypothetical protein